MIDVQSGSSLTLLTASASDGERRGIQRLSRERGAEWSRDEIDALLDDGFIVLATSGGATSAAIAIQPHPEREDAARVAFLWETRPFDALAMAALIERAASVCREHELVAVCAEVDAAQAADIELFTALGFAILEHGERRAATPEELEWMGARAPMTITTPTMLEYAL